MLSLDKTQSFGEKHFSCLSLLQPFWQRPGVTDIFRSGKTQSKEQDEEKKLVPSSSSSSSSSPPFFHPAACWLACAMSCPLSNGVVPSSSSFRLTFTISFASFFQERERKRAVWNNFSAGVVPFEWLPPSHLRKWAPAPGRKIDYPHAGSPNSIEKYVHTLLLVEGSGFIYCHVKSIQALSAPIVEEFSSNVMFSQTL